MKPERYPKTDKDYSMTNFWGPHPHSGRKTQVQILTADLYSFNKFNGPGTKEVYTLPHFGRKEYPDNLLLFLLPFRGTFTIATNLPPETTTVCLGTIVDNQPVDEGVPVRDVGRGTGRVGTTTRNTKVLPHEYILTIDERPFN